MDKIILKNIPKNYRNLVLIQSFNPSPEGVWV